MQSSTQPESTSVTNHPVTTFVRPTALNAMTTVIIDQRTTNIISAQVYSIKFRGRVITPTLVPQAPTPTPSTINFTKSSAHVGASSSSFPDPTAPITMTSTVAPMITTNTVTPMTTTTEELVTSSDSILAATIAILFSTTIILTFVMFIIVYAIKGYGKRSGIGRPQTQLTQRMLPLDEERLVCN